MRPGPAIRTASYVVSCLAIVPRGHAMTASAPQRSNGVPHFTKANCRFVSVRSRIDNRRGWPAARPLRGAELGEEAATPGFPAALSRFSGFPRQLTLENHRLPLALPQSSRQAQESSRLAANTLSHFVSPRKNKKAQHCAETVEDVTSLWKVEEKPEEIPGARSAFSPK